MFLWSRTGISGCLQQVGGSTPNHFMTDVSTCSFRFCGCDVHLHQLLLSAHPLSFSLHGPCLCTRQLDREGDLQIAGILSGSWQEALVAVTHSSTVCGWDTAPSTAALDLPSHLPSASVPFPSQSVIIINGCHVFKSTWDVAFQRPGSLLGSSALQALVLSFSSEHLSYTVTVPSAHGCSGLETHIFSGQMSHCLMALIFAKDMFLISLFFVSDKEQSQQSAVSRPAGDQQRWALRKYRAAGKLPTVFLGFH